MRIQSQTWRLHAGEWIVWPQAGQGLHAVAVVVGGIVSFEEGIVQGCRCLVVEHVGIVLAVAHRLVAGSLLVGGVPVGVVSLAAGSVGSVAVVVGGWIGAATHSTMIGFGDMLGCG